MVCTDTEDYYVILKGFYQWPFKHCVRVIRIFYPKGVSIAMIDLQPCAVSCQNDKRTSFYM